jgi:hypothetical protein
MAEFDYDTLVASKQTPGSIKYWVNHEMVDPDLILTEAQAYIYERVRTWEMRTTASVSIPFNSSTIPLPAHFLEVIKMRFNELADDDLEYVHEHLLRRERDATGQLYTAPPRFWAITDRQIQFENRMDRSYTGEIIYYRRPDDLGQGVAATNWLTIRFPTLVRRACLMFGYEQRRRMEDFNAEVALVEMAIDRVNVTEDMARRTERHR